MPSYCRTAEWSSGTADQAIAIELSCLGPPTDPAAAAADAARAGNVDMCTNYSGDFSKYYSRVRVPVPPAPTEPPCAQSALDCTYCSGFGSCSRGGPRRAPPLSGGAELSRTVRGQTGAACATSATWRPSRASVWWAPRRSRAVRLMAVPLRSCAAPTARSCARRSPCRGTCELAALTPRPALPASRSNRVRPRSCAAKPLCSPRPWPPPWCAFCRACSTSRSARTPPLWPRRPPSSTSPTWCVPAPAPAARRAARLD